MVPLPRALKRGAGRVRFASSGRCPSPSCPECARTSSTSARFEAWGSRNCPPSSAWGLLALTAGILPSVAVDEIGVAGAQEGARTSALALVGGFALFALLRVRRRLVAAAGPEEAWSAFAVGVVLRAKRGV